MFIPISSISISPNRQRREFDEQALQELASSISESASGLLHPIVVRSSGIADEFTLVAGERRLRAIKDIYSFGRTFRHAGSEVPEGQVPVVNLLDLDSIDAFEAELEENIRRKDLTIIEQAQATSQLLDLRTQQAARDGRPAPTTGDIAKEVFSLPPGTPASALGSYRESVKSQLIVAKHSADPDVKRAKTVKEAVKIIKRKEEATRNADMAASIGQTFTHHAHSLLQRDSLAWMKEQPADQFPIILTDPPYGIGADEFSDSGAGVDAQPHFYDDSYENWKGLMKNFAGETFRLASAEAHLYAFCDVTRFVEFADLMRTAGWRVFRTPLIWLNLDGFRAPWPEIGPQRKYECILFAEKGGRRANKLGADVIECRKDAAQGHPAQKPVALLKELLARSARPGDRVLDPFAGSGSTLVACHELNLACMALEKDAGAYGMAARRLSLLAAEPGLF